MTVLSTMDSTIRPFEISIEDSKLSDLRSRLGNARFPDELDESGWEYGAPLADVKRLAAHWQKNFDWRAVERELNQLPQFATYIQAEGYENLNIHFVHRKSEVKNAIPLLFVHGWPGSFLEALKILQILPTGGDGTPTFDIVIPSLPNFGFSEGTKRRGWAVDQHAEVLNKLMLRLGYDKYVAQGGDWGYSICRTLSIQHPKHCVATHLNMDGGRDPSLFSHPGLYLRALFTPLSDRERKGVKRTAWFDQFGFGYNLLQATKPQTIGYALSDSPVGLLAWIYEKLHDWSDEYPWTDNEICTWVSMYWFSTAGPAAAGRIYHELGKSGPWGKRITRADIHKWHDVKVGLSHFPHDIHVLRSTRTRTIGNIVFEGEHASGGHFAAWERPEELAGDLRMMFGKGGGAFGVVKGRDGY